MADHVRPPALSIADAAGLDFLNSVATLTDEEFDWIADGEGLVDWLAQAGLVSPDTAASLNERALPGELDKVAEQARDLREWFRAFVRRHMGKSLRPDAVKELGTLNKLLERNEGYSQIRSEGGKLELAVTRRWRSPETLLLPVGEMLAKFVCDEDFANVKACEGHRCTLLFADHTRRRARRWCSMGVCGNRAKQAAHRERVRKQR